MTFKITAEEKQLLLKRRAAEGSVRMKIKVSPPGLKAVYVKDFNEIPRLFTDVDIEGAVFSILLGSVTVGVLDSEKVIGELYP